MSKIIQNFICCCSCQYQDEFDSTEKNVVPTERILLHAIYNIFLIVANNMFGTSPPELYPKRSHPPAT